MEIGAPSRETLLERSVVVSSRPKNRRRRPDNSKALKKDSKGNFFTKLPDPDRRKLLAVMGALGAGLALMLGRSLLEGKPGTPDQAFPTRTPAAVGPTMAPKPTEALAISDADLPYSGWEAFRNGNLTENYIDVIGAELSNSDYPGYAEVGALVAMSQHDFASIPQVSPDLIAPVRFAMADLDDRGAVATFEHLIEGVYRDVQVRDLKTGSIDNALMVAVKGGSLATVTFDNDVVNGSPALRRLLTVKEMSVFLYMDEMRRHILEEVSALKGFDIPEEELADFLVVNAYFTQAKPKPSGFGFYFDNIVKILDGAGYWHTLQAYAEGIRRADLTMRDVQALTGQAVLMKAAVERGLFNQQPDGSYAWAEGITPFSKEWIEIVELVS